MPAPLRKLVPLLVVPALLAAAALPAGAATTRLVSKTSAGTPANGDSGDPSISASGRYVAFQSHADNLPGNDAFWNIYVHDRNTKTTRLVSKKTNGTPADGDSSAPSISASGRFVAFQSAAPNLPGNDGFLNVYVHDRETGKTRLVSRKSNGTPADGASSQPAIRSGRYVAFRSTANNLPGNDAFANIYVHDRKTKTTRLVSKTSNGTPADGSSATPSISSSGRHVAFQSGADNLPGNDAVSNIYVHDRETKATRLVSKRTDGTPADGTSTHPSISNSGRHVAFESGANNLPGNDAVSNIYVHDRETKATRLVSKRTDGTPADGHSHSPSMRSGRYVAFQSTANNLPGENANADVYLHDRKAGTTRLVSRTSSGTPANGNSFSPSIAAGGRHVAFVSDASNLAGNNAFDNIYLRRGLT
jgi:Tol biopolymer transport system component